MAKKAAVKQVSLTVQIERAVQQAMDSVPGIRSVPEGEYIDAALNALDGIVYGLKMREQEIKEE